jgi:tetratricopeptide (TPR) repeat protein
LTALARNGQWTDGLALFERHPELPRDRPDVFALEVLLRAATGDVSGLADAFERAGEQISRGAGGGAAPDPEAAAHALVVAGTLRARGRGADDVGGAEDVAPEATRLYRRALDIAAGYAPALDAVERPLWTAERSAALRELLEHRLKQVKKAASAATDVMTREPHAGASPERAYDGAELASQILEDLVVVCRDRLDDPTSARRYQDELMAATGGDVRAWARRHDLELAAAAHGQPSRPEIRAGILRALAERAGEPDLKSALLVEAARLAAGADNPALAEGLLRQALISDHSGRAASGLEHLAPGADTASAAAARAAVVRDECARLIASGDSAPEKTARLRALRFRVAWHALGAGQAAEALEALGPLRAAGDHLAVAWSWEIARRSGDPQQRLSLLRSALRGPESGLLEQSGDLGEALEAAGDLPAAAIAFRDAQRRDPATESALGLLRVASALGDGAAVLEATRLLAARADDATASHLKQEVGFLELFEGTSPVTPGADRRLDGGDGAADGPVGVVLRWAAGVRGNDALGAAAGLLAIARALPDAGTPESVNDRNGLLARAAARARLGGTALAGAVHDQVAALSAGAAPIGVGLSDLPVAGRPERIAARLARAERTGGHLAYALDLERGLDAEARGDGPAALDGFARAVVRDPEGIEALDGIKRVALATGDRVGAARAGVRLGAVLRVPARAAAEFAMAGQIWEDLGMPAEAGIAYWHAFARDSGSDWLYERLRHLLTAERDGEGLDRLYGHRLAAMQEPRARTELLLERARHRLDHLDNRKAAIEDFKRILKIDPDHRLALRQLATLAMKMEYFTQAVRFIDRLLARGGDEPEAAALRLELADAHEAAHDPARAVEVLRRAAAARPLDVAPWQRLTDLLLRTGDWSGALASLRSWDAVLSDPIAKSGIWVRIGCLSRDHGRDVTAAAAAFATAADLDPLGEGLRELVTLHGRAGAVAARRQALDRAIAQMRQTLVAAPLDVARLRRLREMYGWSNGDGDGDGGGAMAVDVAVGARLVGQLLALLGEDVERSSAPRPQLRGTLPEDFWIRLRAPGSGRLAAETWPTIAPAVAALFPAVNQPRSNQRERVAPGTEPRLAWVETAAAAVGLPGMELWMPRKGAVEPGDESVIPLDGGTPGLWLGPGALTGNAAVRFRVGRALALMRERAVVIDRVAAPELTTLFSAAARIAGASAAVASTAQVTDTARALGRAMARKDRKALEAQASRFELEPSDAAGFRESVLATADRLGLFIAGDVAAAARVTGDFDPSSDVVLTSAAIASRPRAIQLIRFALSDDYLALRHASEVGEL